MEKMDINKLQESYENFIDELENKKTKDRLETYAYIRLLWHKLNVDLQTWKMILEDFHLISELKDGQLKEIFEAYRDAVLAISKASKNSLNYDAIREVFESLKEMRETKTQMFG